MAKEGWLAWVLSAKPLGRPDQAPIPLDNLDGQGTDLLDALAEVADVYVGRVKPESEDRWEAAYRFDSSDSRSSRHYVMLDGATGPFGTAGRLIHVDDGSEARYSQRQSTMTELRGMIMRSPGDRYGLVFSERRAQRTLKRPLEEGPLKALSRHFRLKFTLQAHVDLEAWTRYFDAGDITEVTRVWASNRIEDIVPETGKPSELAMKVDGPLAKRMKAGDIADSLRSLVGGAPPRGTPSAIRLQEVTPRNEGDFEHRRLVVQLQVGNERRTVVIDKENPPQWFYETTARLSAAEARAIWVADAPRLLSVQGSTIAAGWEVVPAAAPRKTGLGVSVP